MDKIKCPACGAEMDADQENCPSCGAPVAIVNQQGGKGTPIDNKEAINEMLEKASMLVEKGREMGIEGLDAASDIPEGDEDLMGIPGMPEGEENPARPASFDDVTVTNAPGVTLFEMDDNGNVIPEKEPEPPKPQKKSKKEKAPKEKNISPSSAEKKQKKKQSKGKASFGIIILCVVLSLAIGGAAGFFGKTLLFPDFPAPSCQSFADKAVKSVNSLLSNGEEIIVAESYVKEFTGSTQCMIRAFYTKGETVSEKWYRVKVEKEDSKKIHVYNQYTDEELEAMYNSSNDEERAKAAVLSGLWEETKRYMKEISEGDGWTEVNSTLLNNTIHPFKG